MKLTFEQWADRLRDVLIQGGWFEGAADFERMHNMDVWKPYYDEGFSPEHAYVEESNKLKS